MFKSPICKKNQKFRTPDCQNLANSYYEINFLRGQKPKTEQSLPRGND